MGTAKNFVTANAVEAILQVPAVRYSEEPDYMGKQDYGKVPAYLSQVKEEIKRENERREIIYALKQKWDHVNRGYQLCTHKSDFTSFGDIAKKKGFEAELKQLEADIAKLEKPA